ncbi:hypothetical protein COOONC_12194, partial [Cooperia oncophora]
SDYGSFQDVVPEEHVLHCNCQEVQWSGGNIHEPIYGIEMRIVDIDEGTMKQFESALEAVNPALRFPSKNDYIATKFDLKPRETTNGKH